MADPLTVEGIVAPLISLGAIITISLVVWNASRRVTTIEVTVKNMQKDFTESKSSLQTSHKDDISQLKIDLEKTKSDRKAEIAESAVALQKQIDSVRTDVKEQAGRVTQNDTKIGDLIGDVRELKDTDKENYLFHERWNQRIENRIENLRNEFITMISIFHGNKKTDDK